MFFKHINKDYIKIYIPITYIKYNCLEIIFDTCNNVDFCFKDLKYLSHSLSFVNFEDFNKGITGILEKEILNFINNYILL